MLPSLDLGGIERGVVELSRELVRHNTESIVLSTGGALAQQIDDDGGRHIVFDCAAKNPFNAPMRAWRLRRLLQQLKPDIIHIRSRVPAWLLRFAGAPCPTISTFHGLYKTGRYSAIMTVADKVICPSTAVFEHVSRYYGTPDERLTVIHRGLDLEYFDPQKTDTEFCRGFRQKHRLENAVIASIVGRLSTLKGHDIFIRAIARAKQRIPGLVGLIVGDSGKISRLSRLKTLATELGVGEHLRFVGAQKQMREFYHLSDFVVSASRQPEAFGRTVAEALAMERPVIAPAHGGALDIIRDGKNGYLVPPADDAALADAIIRGTSKKWQELRESVQCFSLTQMTEKTITVYEKIHSQRNAT